MAGTQYRELAPAPGMSDGDLDDVSSLSSIEEVPSHGETLRPFGSGSTS